MASSSLTACGSQGQSIHKPFFFQKRTDIDSPFTCVKKILCFSVGRHLHIEKGALKLIKTSPFNHYPKIIIMAFNIMPITTLCIILRPRYKCAKLQFLGNKSIIQWCVFRKPLKLLTQ